jgi:hypothetical protein
MTQQTELRPIIVPIWLKVIVCFWMFAVIFVYLVLFGPPQFWSVLQRLGFGNLFEQWRDVLQPFFVAGYLS